MFDCGTVCSCGEHEVHDIRTSRSTCTLAAFDIEAAIISTEIQQENVNRYFGQKSTVVHKKILYNLNDIS